MAAGSRAPSYYMLLLCARPPAGDGGPGDLAWFLPCAAHLSAEKERAKGQKGHADKPPQGIREAGLEADGYMDKVRQARWEEPLAKALR